MEDQVCSPEKYPIKNSHDKNIFYLNETNQGDIFFISVIFRFLRFLYMMKMFLTE